MTALVLAVFAPSASAHRGQRAQGKPGYGGTIAVANQQPDCLDPQKSGLAASEDVFSQVVDPLLAIDDSGRLRPDLALSWTISAKGKLLTFHLGRGVRFSNGDPFDARAVKYTFERALNPATRSPVTAGNLDAVQTITAPDRYTVRLSLKTPSRPLMTSLADLYQGILDPKATETEGDESCQKPIGAGPFEVSSVGPGFSSI